MAIGIVRGLIGKVTVTDAKGSVRELRVGDAVELNDNVQASAGGTVHIVFNNGNFATVGSHDTLILSEAVIDPTGAKAQVAEGQSVADIQAMIAAGMDPTQIAEATAAGADAGLAGDTGQGGHTFVVVNQDAARGDVTPGFATNTFANPGTENREYTGGDRFLLTPDNEEVIGLPVIDLDASTVSLGVRESGVKGDDASIPGSGPNAEYAGKLVDTGKIVATDPNGDPLSYSVKSAGSEGNGAGSAEGKYGTLTIDENGNYVYELKDGLAQGLSQGDSITETFTIMVSDGRGGMVSQDITVTVNGTNDLPELSMNWGENGNGVTEDVSGSVAGKWNVKDDDADGGHQTLSVAGKDGTTGTATDGVIGAESGNSAASFETDYGKLTLNPDGSYSYELNNDSDAVQKLGDKQTQTETFEVTTTDAHGSTSTETITVVITGTNDAPVLVPTPGGDTAPDLNLKESGQASKGDPATDGTHADGINQSKVPGILTDEKSFTVRDVDAGDKLTASIVDAAGNPVSEVVTNSDTGVMTLVTEYGTLTVTPGNNEDGTVTYTYHFDLNDGAVNGLSQYDPDNPESDVNFIDMNFNVSISDGHGGKLDVPIGVHIEGTNDAPVVRYSTIHVKEDGVYNGNNETTGDGKDNGGVLTQHDRLTATGKVPFSDVDNEGDVTLSATLKGIDANGEVHVNVSGSAVAGTQETVKVIGQQMDSDNPDIQILKTNYGELRLNTVTGDYTFTLDTDKAQHLAQGEKFQFSFTVTATDGHGAQGNHMIGVTVEGANDAPKLSFVDGNNEVTSDNVLDVYEKGVNSDTPTDSGKVKGDDADRGASLKYSLVNENGKETDTITTEYGTLKINPDGTYTFTIDNDSNDVKILGPDDVKKLGFTVRVTDEHGAYDQSDIIVNVHGATNEITVDQHLSVNEHGLTSSADHSESALVVVDGFTITRVITQGEHGTVASNGEGGWTYTLNGAFDQKDGQGANMAEGADKIRVEVKDDKGNVFEVEIKVDVKDDIPTIAPDTTVSGSVGDHSVSGTIDDLGFGADSSGGQSITVGDVTATYNGTTHEWTFEGGQGGAVDGGNLQFNLPDGKVSLDPDTGDFTYTPDNGLSNNLPPIEVTITDGDGDKSTGHIHIGVADSGGPSQPAGATEDEIRDSTNNVVQGDKNGHDVNDVLVGDFAGNTTVGAVQDVVNNIYLVVDVSASMKDGMDPGSDVSRLKVVADALDKLFEQMNVADADPHTTVNVTLSIFSGGGDTPKEYNLSVSDWAGKTADDIYKMLDDFKHGDTNFELPLGNASEWADSQAKGDGIYNKVIFVTDANGTEILNTGKAQDYVDKILGSGVDVEAIAIINSYQKQYKDILEELGNKYPLDPSKQPFAQELISLFSGLRGYDPDSPNESANKITNALKGIVDESGKRLYDDQMISDFIKDTFLTCGGKIPEEPGSPMELPDRGNYDGYTAFLMASLSSGMDNLFGQGNVTQVGSTDDINSSLDIGSVIPKPVTYAPGSDLIAGGAGDDIIFGDADLESLKAQVAGLLNVDVKNLTNADLFKYIKEHSDLFDRPDSAFGPVDNGMADALIGGAGNDILYGQGGNDILIADGSHDSLTDIANYLGDHGVASMDHLDFSAGHELGQNIGVLGDALHNMNAHDLNDFANWAEGHLEGSGHGNGGDLLYGGSGDDVLIGGAGHDTLVGGDGNDILFGGSGNDTLIGGHGDNILTGGSGNDTFKYNAGDLEGKTHGDSITDFHVGDVAKDGNADILDLKDLLTGADKLSGGASDLISGGYLQFEDIKQNDDGSVTVKLSIDVNGHEGGADFHNVATITMNGVHLGDNSANHAQELLNQLVQNNEIKI
ncbi:retention module-containing protein [Oxalobacter formigenes]|uniref:Type 1 secretion C-terminal target domain (VC_A0849 subclass) n=2 Tax=Oxalobacter TaxID=846 RepID=C3X868_OXAFO|nr:retention module-containing protein [Oxalobacter formigenes]ARQ78653.1 type I secretion C-terminal target domain-containing protein [Oxalobacter formigenes OXCC13]EEO29394.1 type 1 secretion C-terminal target domain (VC_A0849 subclass) [Oxalobacter formigenes OXCC13]WAW01063.1 retention module-containing protein [Oxalobacter formigenes]WAW03392.1 retention module-containing protein [Oxalobacter formigenes]WAW07450.1 retention module-containing protein [Oxalobacter formigenes]